MEHFQRKGWQDMEGGGLASNLLKVYMTSDISSKIGTSTLFISFY